MSESSQNEFGNEDEKANQSNEWLQSARENNYRIACALFGEPKIKEDETPYSKMIKEVTNTYSSTYHQEHDPSQYNLNALGTLPQSSSGLVPQHVPVCTLLSTDQEPQIVNSDTPISGQIESHNSKTSNKPYPVDAFPQILQEPIIALHEDTHFPIEMIGSTLLAASSLALQPLVSISSPFGIGKAEPCSLYFLILAKPGEGKSPLFDLILEPFNTFTSEIQEEYEEKMKEYETNHAIWKSKTKALEQRFQKATKNGGDCKIEESLLRDHLSIEPKEPKKFEMFYEDATPASIIDGLNNYPYAGVFSEDAITFFTGHLKNKLGLLNKIWKNEPFSLSRKNEINIRLKAYLTFLLMVQHDVFQDYLTKNGKMAISSGFLARFLFTNPPSTLGKREINLNQEKSKKALGILFEEFKIFFTLQKKRFYDDTIPVKNLALTDAAKNLFQEKMSQYQKSTTPGNIWEHIPEFVSKAGNNAIRIAAMFDFYSKTGISESKLNDAFTITEWHLNQAAQYFYESSEQFQLRQDVYDLFETIKKCFAKTGGQLKYSDYHTSQTVFTVRQPWQPFLKYEVKQYAPGRLRGVGNKTEPAFEQLVGLGLIVTVRYPPYNEIYVAIPKVDPFGRQFLQHEPAAIYKLVQCKNNVERPLDDYDHSRLRWS
ncbi:conserved hypothetical protein [Enterobacterales bacterium 8AC]|nr:conserved hypothetical protein [Enterobacterales bacterium 8AC]